MQLPSFSELGLIPELLQAIEILGYEQPSPIQAKAIPIALAGKDILGLSQTGSGKTAAFGLPALQMLDLNLSATQVIIFCPTRELSIQVCEEIHRLGAKLKGLRAIPVYGGAPMDRQVRSLKAGAHVVVGTPGRLLDHLRRKTLNTEHISFAVLDEADRMLDMGFREDMETLLDAIPATRQTFFFSATMNKNVERLISTYAKNPTLVEIERKTVTVDSVEQTYYEVSNRSKIEVLSRLLDLDPPRLGLVFCNTKQLVDECTETLLKRGYAADSIHGDITQAARERVLKRFRAGEVELLIATDVAARGLDIDDIDVVFNYDLPYDPEDYVHRIGRTGRAGRKGRAVSFVFGKDIYRLRNIERYIRQKITRMRIPSQEALAGLHANRIFDSLRDRLESKKYESQEAYIDRLLEQGHSPTEIASVLVCMIFEAGRRESETIAEDTQKFVEKRSDRDDSGPRPQRPKRDFKRDDRGDRGDRPPRREHGDREGFAPRKPSTRPAPSGEVKKHPKPFKANEGGFKDNSFDASIRALKPHVTKHTTDSDAPAAPSTPGEFKKPKRKNRTDKDKGKPRRLKDTKE